MYFSFKQPILYLYISYPKSYRKLIKDQVKSNSFGNFIILGECSQLKESYPLYVQSYKGRNFYQKSKEEKIHLLSLVTKSERILEIKIQLDKNSIDKKSVFKDMYKSIERYLGDIDIKAICFRNNKSEKYVSNFVIPQIM